MALSSSSTTLSLAATQTATSSHFTKLHHVQPPTTSLQRHPAPNEHLTNTQMQKQLRLRLTSTDKWRAGVSFFPAFLKKGKDAKELKEELLEAIAPLDRGAEATPEDQERIDQLARKLEAANRVKEPLKSDLLNGKWELIYTTSTSILQRERPKFLRSRTNYQAINVDTLRAQNQESFPFFNQVTADLTPLSPSKVAVKFDYFKILGLIPVKAPDRARGELDITYLDEDLRISRGDKGNLFILKMVDRSYRIPPS
uniref:Plastid lipid-associated protein/fibrillin conserved domain-containing protein n=1 Tax=Kalanchoe fedtschenkoi TaxID=63787 RepID=A0A7N0RH08_KALFE